MRLITKNNLKINIHNSSGYLNRRSRVKYITKTLFGRKTKISWFNRFDWEDSEFYYNEDINPIDCVKRLMVNYACKKGKGYLFVGGVLDGCWLKKNSSTFKFYEDYYSKSEWLIGYTWVTIYGSQDLTKADIVRRLIECTD